MLRNALLGDATAVVQVTAAMRCSPGMWDADRYVDEHVAGRHDNGGLLYRLLNFGLWRRQYLR